MEGCIVSSEDLLNTDSLKKWLSGYELDVFNPDNAIINRLSPQSEEEYFIKNISEISAVTSPSGKTKIVISFEYLINTPEELIPLTGDERKGLFKVSRFEKTFDLSENISEILSPSDGRVKLQFNTSNNGSKLILVLQNIESAGDHKGNKTLMRVYDWCYSAFSVKILIQCTDGFLQLPSKLSKLSYLTEQKAYCKAYNTSYIPISYDSKIREIEITSMPVFKEPRYITWDGSKEGMGQLVNFSSYSFENSVPQTLEKLTSFIKNTNHHSNKILNQYAVRTQSKSEYSIEFSLDKEAIEAETKLSEKALEILSSNQDALWAFQFLNEVMKEKSLASDSFSSWRPFQLVFILNSITNYFIKNDKKACLLNFPTGMGKTEAFMGFSLWLAAYLRKTKQNFGTVAIIKYPRVMLSKQQARRAIELYTHANKCLVKQKNIDKYPFSIGVLYAKEDTPNGILSTKAGEGFTGEFLTLEANVKAKKKIGFHIDLCPACGHEIKIDPSRTRARILFKCKNASCIYNESKLDSLFGGEPGELPIYVSDEEVTRYTPTIILTTVYKFAAFCNTGRWKTLLGTKLPGLSTDRLYGLFFYKKDKEEAQKYSSKYSYTWFSGAPLSNVPLLPPSLIVVDETHLISGAQAGLIGPIETAFLDVFKIDNNFPLVICSSATINKSIINQNERVYQHQIAQLFGTKLKDVVLFPASLDVYRSEEHAIQRLIVAFYPSLYTQMFAQEKVSSYIFTKIAREKTKYYNKPIFYFNSKSELSQVEHYAFEDRVSRVIKNPQLKHHFIRFSGDMEPSEVDTQLEMLQKTDLWQVILATNLIANGIDSKFFNLMIFNGLPNSNSEYVQARSRTARSEQCTGLSIMILNRNDARERAFLENFLDWHANYEYFYEENPVNKHSDGIVDDTIPRLFHLYAFWLYDDPVNRIYLTDILRNKLEDAKEDLNQTCEQMLGSWLVSPIDHARINSQIKAKITNWLRRYLIKLNSRQSKTIYTFEEPNEFLANVSILQFSDLVEVTLSKQSISKLRSIVERAE